MKPQIYSRSTSGLGLLLIGLFAGLLVFQAPAADSPLDNSHGYQPASDEFDAIGKAVVQLLQTKDAALFATNMSVSAADWQSVNTTNLPVEEREKIKDFAKGAHFTRQQTETSAKALLAQADSLRLDFSKDSLAFHIVPPGYIGKIFFSSSPDADKLQAFYLEKLEVILTTAADTGRTNHGDFKIAVRGLEKFPGGWRFNQGIQWTAFPTNIADEKTMRKLAILEKVTDHKALTSLDDPALLKLGQSLVRFIRERDTNIYATESLMNCDLVWAMFQKSGQKGPSRQELDKEIGPRVTEQVEIARKLINQMDEAGIDLKTAELQITEATLDRSQTEGNPGSLDNMMGEQFKLALSVKTDAKARNGASLSGDYVLAAKTLVRFEEGWRVMDDIHWEKLPAGVIDAKTAAAMEFENYVAKNGKLPLQTSAPEIEFTTVVGERKMKLADLRGKVVILDFWATWCGPCQEPMAALQTLKQKHADWQDKVAIVPLSIDDTLDILRQHVDKHDWTNTFNAWAGEGGWSSIPAKKFRVTGVPTTYVIDREGKIAWAGHPAGEGFVGTVDALLKH